MFLDQTIGVEAGIQQVHVHLLNLQRKYRPLLAQLTNYSPYRRMLCFLHDWYLFPTVTDRVYQNRPRDRRVCGQCDPGQPDPFI